MEPVYQRRASVAGDVPPLAGTSKGGSLLFIEVGRLDDDVRALDGIEPVAPRRPTFRGSDELIVREPARHAVTFAEMSSPA